MGIIGSERNNPNARIYLSIDNCCAHQTEKRRRGVSGGGVRKRVCASVVGDAGDASDGRWVAPATPAGGAPVTLLRRE